MWVSLLSPGLILYCAVLTSNVVSLAEKKECPSILIPHAPPTKEWVLTNTHLIDKSQKGPSDRVREKMAQLSQQLQQLQRSKEEVERRLQEPEEVARRRAWVSETTLMDAMEQYGRRIEEVELRAQESDRRAMNAEARALQSEGRIQEAERRAELLDQEKIVERRQHGASVAIGRGGDEGVKEWVVRRREIHMTGDRLGGGGWGEVMVAKFRGSQVAAKVLYRDLQSPYYHSIFQREMDMAAKVRHPNLVQFLGASMDQEMVILMELMSTSLRQHIAKNTPNLSFSTAVSLDVAKALNYLHLMQPEAILHRDISSANVLLAPLPGYRWRAKVTDYGSVNLQNLLTTKNPGNPVYSAPESHDPAQQSPKMDIFSFGVVMLETIVGEFPVVSHREAMIGAIKEPQWTNLIRQCTHQDKEQRPTAAQILTLI